MSSRTLTRDEIAIVLRKRTPYRVTLRPGVVVAWLDPWHGAIVRPGRTPTVLATIPDPRFMLLFVIGCFLTVGILGLVWLSANHAATEVVDEIRTVFRRDLGIATK